MIDRPILRGWKEIEVFLGLERSTILAKGYPVRKDGNGGRNDGVLALKQELLDYAQQQPRVGERPPR